MFKLKKAVNDIVSHMAPFTRYATLYSSQTVEDNHFFLGLISGSCLIVPQTVLGRETTQLEFGKANVNVVKKLFKDDFTLIMSAIAERLEINEPDFARGNEAAGVYWGLIYGTVRFGQYDFLDVLLEHEDATLEKSGNSSAKNNHTNEDARLLSVVTLRIGEEVADGAKWDRTDNDG